MMPIPLARSAKPVTRAMLVLLAALGLATLIDQVRRAPAVPAAVQRAMDPRSDGERAVEAAQRRLVRSPDNPRALTQLASAFLLIARESGDPSYYPRAQALLERSLAAAPDQADTLIALGSLANSRHEFMEALILSQRAVELAPEQAAAYGVMTDALVELGRYDEAVEIAQRMVDLRPDQVAYSRVSYLRELHGDLEGAEAAMRLAVQAGHPTAEATAWSEVQLGNLRFARGDQVGAEEAYSGSLRRIDGYVYGVAGLARASAARAELRGAAALYEGAVHRMPLPEFAAALGDVYMRLGDEERAQQLYELVAATQRLLAANGVRVDIDLALFNADHGLDLEGALEAARAEYAVRPSVHVADTLAWVEYQAGDLAGARAHSTEALHLGTRDPAMLYRAGVIAQANDEPERAAELLRRSAAMNPRFSVLYAEDLALRLTQLAHEEADR